MPFHQVELESYITVSPTGFTHYVEGLPVEFVPIERWLDERFLYRAVRELRFFRDFPARKAFRLWRDAGCHERMSKAGSLLEERLFLLHPLFRPLYLEEIQGMRAVRVQFSQSQSLEDFQRVQQVWQQDLIARAARLAERLRLEVRREGSSAGFAYATLAAAVARPSSQGGRGLGVRPTPGLIRPGMPRADGDALEALGFSKDVGFGQRSMLRKECVRLVRFARLADLLASQALVDLAQESLADVVRSMAVAPSLQPLLPASPGSLQFLRQASGASSAKGGHLQEAAGGSPSGVVNPLVFKVAATFLGNSQRLEGLQLQPACEQLRVHLLESMNKGLEVATLFERLSQHPDLEAYRALIGPPSATEQSGAAVRQSPAAAA
ncbi:unnamed protein product, partial [Polarella glacialis]